METETTEITNPINLKILGAGMAVVILGVLLGTGVIPFLNFLLVMAALSCLSTIIGLLAILSLWLLTH
jgi:hypothetical protein